MKINHGYQDSRAASAQEAAKTQETAAAAQSRVAKAGAGANKAGNADEVDLSSLASALQGALSDSPDRSVYLDRLAGEFAAGTYKPDAKATANGIVTDTLLEPPEPK
ncbi:MAG: flagellar biosynthesis anti-sigma factor FlgM [Bryobacteraceae bacterium]